MENNLMKFSLVLATLDRDKELSSFLDSICSQSYKNFELIVVDQNKDDRVDKILSKYKTRFSILHIKSEPGLSRSRNAGLLHVKGEIVSFPDDDCSYPPNLLAEVEKLLSKNKDWGGVAGRVANVEGKSTAGRWDKHSGLITKSNVWGRAVSIGLFLRTNVIQQVGTFDVTLGAGSGTSWGSGEETDYVIRAIKKGFSIIYLPYLYVYHPEPTSANDPSTIIRAKKYGAGMGRVLHKHDYPISFLIYFCFRALVGAAKSLILKNTVMCRFYYASFMGRISGWFS